MTKKHFIKFAATVKADIESAKRFGPDEAKRTEDAARYAASLFADVAAGDNDRFDRARFMTACGLNSH